MSQTCVDFSDYGKDLLLLFSFKMSNDNILPFAVLFWADDKDHPLRALAGQSGAAS